MPLICKRVLTVKKGVPVAHWYMKSSKGNWFSCGMVPLQEDRKQLKGLSDLSKETEIIIHLVPDK